MASTFDPYADLDRILFELGTPKTFYSLKKTFPDNPIPAFNHARLEQGIEKLREDGYVYVINNMTYVKDIEIEDGWYVRRTYNGEILMLAGGYVISQRQAFRLERGERRRNTWLTVGTLVAGLGAIALVVWEMYKTFCLHE